MKLRRRIKLCPLTRLNLKLTSQALVNRQRWLTRLKEEPLPQLLKSLIWTSLRSKSWMIYSLRSKTRVLRSATTGLSCRRATICGSKTSWARPIRLLLLPMRHYHQVVPQLPMRLSLKGTRLNPSALRPIRLSLLLISTKQSLIRLHCR
jgi:hypothetical protein